jgi:hypothetical protein
MMPEHMRAAVIATDAMPGTEPLSWDEVRERFAAERWYWLATAGAGGRPLRSRHVYRRARRIARERRRCSRRRRVVPRLTATGHRCRRGDHVLSGAAITS